jgi:hypothetical protein
MTSSDVLDTCLAVQLKQASDILLKDLDGLLAALKKRAGLSDPLGDVRDFLQVRIAGPHEPRLAECIAEAHAERGIPAARNPHDIGKAIGCGLDQGNGRGRIDLPKTARPLHPYSGLSGKNTGKIRIIHSLYIMPIKSR